MSKGKKMEPVLVELDQDVRGDAVDAFKQKLLGKVAGQDHAVETVADAFLISSAGLAAPGRPIDSSLFLGPTGTGKTYLVESIAEATTGSADAVLRIDCGEFQLEQDVAKLLGSPPGYRGDEIKPRLSQAAIDARPFVLFDEIEKAHEAVRRLMFSILDKGVITLGNNVTVDFSKTHVYMTSNVGAGAMQDAEKSRLGFELPKEKEQVEIADQETLTKVAIAAAKKDFDPAFLGRIDHVVVFNPLKESVLHKIVDMELNKVCGGLAGADGASKFAFEADDNARRFLVEAMSGNKSGARGLKHAIKKHVVFPFAAFLATGQVAPGDKVHIGHQPGQKRMTFHKEECGALTPAEAAVKSHKAATLALA